MNVNDLNEAAPRSPEEALNDLKDTAMASASAKDKIGIRINYRSALQKIQAGDIRGAQPFIAKLKTYGPKLNTQLPKGTSAKNVSGGDSEYERELLIDKINNGLGGALRNVKSNHVGAIKKVLSPEEYAKFLQEIESFTEGGKTIKAAISKGNSKVLKKYGPRVVDFVKQASYGLNARAESVSSGESNVWLRPGEEKRQSEAEQEVAKLAKTVSAPTIDDADDFFAANNIGADELGMNPDSEVADDPEGNEVSFDPDELDSMAMNESEFAAKIKKMMDESYSKSYKDATKKLL